MTKPKRQSPQITADLLKIFDEKTLVLIKSTYYRRGSDNCDMTFTEYVKTLKRLNFTDGMRIIRIDKSKKWTKNNIRVYDDPMHKKLKEINAFYRENDNKKPKKIIIKIKEVI